MKYLSVILVFLFSAASVSSQVLNGSFDRFTGNVPNDWTVGNLVGTSQGDDTTSHSPFIKLDYAYDVSSGYNVILLDDTTASHPYGALLDAKVKKLTLKYRVSAFLYTVPKIAILLHDHTGFIYEVAQQVLVPTVMWASAEIDIPTKHRDLTGPNYIEIRIVSTAAPNLKGSGQQYFVMQIDEIALDTNASLAVSKPNSITNSLTITPNPASSQTRITYDLSSAEPITTTIYSVTGTEVRRILSPAGNTSGVMVETSDLPNGVYYVRSNIGNSTLSQKLVVAH